MIEGRFQRVIREHLDGLPKSEPAVIVQHPSASVTFDPAPTCPDCHLPMRLHRGVTGSHLTCEIAQHVKRLKDRPEHPQRWNDPRPQVTAEVRAALIDGRCGPEMEIFIYGLSNDLQLAIAHTIANVAITGYLADLARRQA